MTDHKPSTTVNNEQTIRDEWRDRFENAVPNRLLYDEHGTKIRDRIVAFIESERTLARNQGILAGRQQACAELMERVGTKMNKLGTFDVARNHYREVIADIAQIIGIKDEA